MDTFRKLRNNIIIGFAVIVCMAIAVGFIVDRQRLAEVIKTANPMYIIPAIIFALLSYLCLSYNFYIFCRVFGIKAHKTDLLKVGYVSTVVNNIISAGGAAQYYFRILIMKQWNEAISNIFAASFFQIYMNMLALMILLLIGIFRITLTHQINSSLNTGLVSIATLLLVTLVVFTLVFFFSQVRHFILSRISGILKVVIKKDFNQHFNKLEQAIGRGVAVFKEKPSMLITQFIILIMDWGSAILCLYFCLRAFSLSLPIEVLVTGFTAGQAAGFLSLTPGGVGIQDGSMAGIFTLFGISLEKVLFGSLLYRIIYYFLPALVSLLFFKGLFKKEQ